jgi:hypothetical protein
MAQPGGVVGRARSRSRVAMTDCCPDQRAGGATSSMHSPPASSVDSILPGRSRQQQARVGHRVLAVEPHGDAVREP